MREESLARRIESIITNYEHGKPFAIYLKDYFRRNPVMGSTDRRMARTWSYNYLRIGRAIADQPFRTRLAVGCFLCSVKSDTYLEYLFKDIPAFSKDLELSVEEKLERLSELFPEFNRRDIFPMYEHLSEEIPAGEWIISFLKKPRVWIRLRKNHSEELIQELKKLSIDYRTTPEPLTISFSPDVQLEKTESFQKGYFEIQDLSSQQTSKFMNPSDHEKWWDACAGSGGKSLLLMELAKDVFIIGSDSRPSILKNYAARMLKAGHSGFDTLLIDFEDDKASRRFNLPQFDGIVADVPCSGSGTWSRNPEWNMNDHSDMLQNVFVPLQRKIISRCVENLKVGKPLIYITCSVFKEENEENIRYFETQLPLETGKFQYFKGFTSGADTLFAARFIRK
jgi:16S rRNA (cytosine967-C5)-methyltransferase